MSGVAKALGTVSGIASTVLAFIPGMQPLAAAFALNSALMSGVAALTAKKPPAQGSATDITIGASDPSSFIVGQSYFGGARKHMVGYGSQNDVPNAYLLAVDVYGVAGPYTELVQLYADFTPINFDGGGKAIGHYSNDTLYRDYQLGATPEASALSPHFSGAPDWGSAYKLSGKAAVAWNARFPKDGKRYGSGFFQTGAEWKGPAGYDPRENSEYPGGSGSQRWADPRDKTAFSAAKATWAYPEGNPGIEGLNYALGRYERDETNSSAEYVKVFGIGLATGTYEVDGYTLDGVIEADFVAFANVCDDNGWKAGGIIQEPGDKWANLKSILEAGGAEPCFRGGKLGLRIQAPRVAIDTITRDDLADGEVVIPGTRSYRDRLNTIIPKYRSPSHKWEYVATQEPVQVTEFVTQDGEEKSAERQFNLVQDPDQAAQLAGYALVMGRERGPIEMQCKPRLRGYGPGDMLTLDMPELKLSGDHVILSRTIDPATMQVSLTLVEENPDKHAFALGLTGTSPPAITITPPGDLDDIAGGASAPGALEGLTVIANEDGTLITNDWDPTIRADRYLIELIVEP